jgi:hypothetical protein
VLGLQQNSTGGTESSCILLSLTSIFSYHHWYICDSQWTYIDTSLPSKRHSLWRFHLWRRTFYASWQVYSDMMPTL